MFAQHCLPDNHYAAMCCRHRQVRTIWRLLRRKQPRPSGVKTSSEHLSVRVSVNFRRCRCSSYRGCVLLFEQSVSAVNHLYLILRQSMYQLAV
jgi:hypothetical protein